MIASQSLVLNLPARALRSRWRGVQPRRLAQLVIRAPVNGDRFSPLSPVRGGKGGATSPPHPPPLSPAYRGEGGMDNSNRTVNHAGTTGRGSRPGVTGPTAGKAVSPGSGSGLP